MTLNEFVDQIVAKLPEEEFGAVSMSVVAWRHEGDKPVYRYTIWSGKKNEFLVGHMDMEGPVSAGATMAHLDMYLKALKLRNLDNPIHDEIQPLELP